MEYILTNLPRYVTITARSEIANSVVGQGALLLISEDGHSMTAKQADGSYKVIGIDPSDTTATAADVASGKLFYTASGVLTEGTATGGGGTDVSDTTATAATVLAGYDFHLADGTKATGTIQTVTASLSANVVTVPAGYIATAQTLTVSEAGAATVSDNVVTIPVGYIASARTVTVGTAKAAATYTPTTSDQTIASGQYLSGDQTIKGDANLLAANIMQGVTIFGVTGTAASGGADVTLGVVDAQGKFQAFTFSGTIPTNYGTPETVTEYKTWNSTIPPPPDLLFLLDSASESITHTALTNYSVTFPGNYANFNGNARLEMPSSLYGKFDALTSIFCAVWIKYSSASPVTMCAFAIGSDTQFSLWPFDTDFGGPSFIVKTTGGAWGASNGIVGASDTDWHFAAFYSQSGGDQFACFDTSFTSNTAVSAFWNNAKSSGVIGRRDNGSDAFTGNLAQLRFLFNRSMTYGEFQAICAACKAEFTPTQA